jgi:hypothetical protein
MTLQLLHSEFPYISGKFDFLLSVCITSSPTGAYAVHLKTDMFNTVVEQIKLGFE